MTVKALAALAFASLVSWGCSEQSSLYIRSDRSESVIVRVYFNDFGESFGYSVPPGEAWAWASTEGRVAGPIAVFSSTCRLLWASELPPTGGYLELDAAGGAAIATRSVGPRPGEGPFLEYTTTCADAPNPRLR